MPYAIIRTGGKQYRVNNGDVLRVEKLEAEVGAELALGELLGFGEGAGLKLDQKSLDGQSVQAKVVRHGRGAKVIIWTYRRRKGAARKKGHRQDFTEVRITSIPGGN